jgi:formylglycine-generating enzyme required for sulfatase activity
MNPVKHQLLFAGFLAGLTASLAACGGAQTPVAPLDEYGRRVSRCIAAPRAISDAAQAGMLSVPAGQMIVGSSPQERALATQLSGAGSATLFADETPRRMETLPAFRIDRTPVTNRAFAEFVNACGTPPPDAETVTPQRWTEFARRLASNIGYDQVMRFIWPGSAPLADREEHPVVLLTHDDAAFYCAWRGGRLPSEQEWERAARGQQGQLFPWGGRFDARQVNTREHGNGDTVNVGSFDLVNSPVGAKDMGGLVFEWTRSTIEGDPGARVIKGNSWNRLGGQSRGAARSVRPQDIRDVEIGFRCAGNVQPTQTRSVAADAS